MASSPETEPRFITLLNDEMRSIYFALSPDDHKRIKAGERVETPEGLAFHVHEQVSEVAGRELRIIVATPMLKSKEDASAAYARLKAEHESLAAKLWKPAIPSDVREAFNRYHKAWGDYSICLGDLWRSAARENSRAQLLPEVISSELARMKAKKGHAGSEKAAAKARALELWKERNAGKHPKLRTVEQFATEVMRRWPVLTSPKVICGWSATWSKQVAAGQTPSC